MHSIGMLAKRTGTKVQTIRYYEQIGLLPEPERTLGGQRRYRDDDLDRLSFIRHGRQLGFTLEAIRELLDLSDNPLRPCAEVDRIALGQLKEVERRIERLTVLKVELERMIAECAQGRVAECHVLEVLRNQDLCVDDHDGPHLRRPRS
jgi:DNA-binding transcriptional MerR regulator